jgi:large subunit ribosomal protein L13
MKTIFSKQQFHVPKIFLIDANQYTLGRLTCLIAALLIGKYTSLYLPFLDQGNYVILYNINKIKISGKKKNQKYYYKKSKSPGGLKKESYLNLSKRIPLKIIEHAIKGMLPKNKLKKKFFKRLYLYTNSKMRYKNFDINFENLILKKNWFKFF